MASDDAREVLCVRRSSAGSVCVFSPLSPRPLLAFWPSLPPPLFCVASATLPLISAAVCFLGLALPPMPAA